MKNLLTFLNQPVILLLIGFILAKILERQKREKAATRLLTFIARARKERINAKKKRLDHQD